MMPHPDRTLFDMLQGHWVIARKIDDRFAKMTGTFEGSATFQPTDTPGALKYHETGTLKFGSQEHAAERLYLWRCETPNSAKVYFDDGRFFHTVSLRNGIADTEHLCEPDIYNGHYSFDTADRWGLMWRVKGPRKDYTMDSRYTRA